MKLEKNLIKNQTPDVLKFLDSTVYYAVTSYLTFFNIHIAHKIYFSVKDEVNVF